ncbi:unnamed protein product [Coccothraustes coccothraustes]
MLGADRIGLPLRRGLAQWWSYQESLPACQGPMSGMAALAPVGGSRGQGRQWPLAPMRLQDAQQAACDAAGRAHQESWGEHGWELRLDTVAGQRLALVYDV